MYRKLGILNERQSMTPESYRADIPESDFDRYLYLVARALAMVCKENDSLMILQVFSVRGQEALRYDERLPKRVCPSQHRDISAKVQPRQATALWISILTVFETE